MMATPYDDLIRLMMQEQAATPIPLEPMVYENRMPTTARVPPDTLSDVSGLTAPVDVGDEVSSYVDPRILDSGMRNRTIERGRQPFYDANIMMDAIENRRRYGR